MVSFALVGGSRDPLCVENAMLKEVQSIQEKKKKTWELVELPKGKNVIECK
jgi:hypothetical protein